MKLALAGAISTSSAQRASSMCPIAASAAWSQRSSRVGRPDTAWNVSGVTNCFAAAVIAYEMIAGVHPFVAPSTIEMQKRVLRDRPEPLPRLRADVPVELDRILQRALEKEVTDRFPDAFAFQQALNRCVATLTIEDPPSSESTPSMSDK